MAKDSIKYRLDKNPLTADPDDCMAQVVDSRVFTEDDIRKEMLKRGTELSESTMIAYQNLREKVIADIIENGGSINTPLFNTSFSITGVFTDENDTFDKSRHAVKLNVNAGSAIREAASKTTTQKTEGKSTDPYITRVKDTVSGDGTVIKAGTVIEITGARLKFDATDAEQGVFVVTASGESRAATVIDNKPARVVVIFPADVNAGDFTLEVRTKLTGNRNESGKTLKVGRYGKTLTAVK